MARRTIGDISVVLEQQKLMSKEEAIPATSQFFHANVRRLAEKLGLLNSSEFHRQQIIFPGHFGR